ncbi:hypothetical protein G5C60_05625 [Streptomyces sp. HC44]|uniref:Uncharacterized protein n=1 Tax=Streptomyces scabichelini TaxID=2711217 RepID=A0A6G4UZG5_9ACTN|nr:hypothetical protein [Streptomyces scabichelini]NGO07139.1 hypothetical protein [Streptomyces scabichelini]
MEQSGTSARLTGAVQDLASEVVSALRSGDPFRVVGIGAGREGTGDLTLAAVRVLGADALLPSVLLRMPPDPDDLAVFRKAVQAYPPPTGASPASVWSHWAMARTLRRLDASLDGVPGDGAEPGAAWLDSATWQFLTHQLAVLAPLALPADDCAVARVAMGRPVDVARGFVRAVRRRDWLQAAAAGRWLTLLDGVPRTLGLETGLDFVAQMGGDDPRVVLHVQAAQLMRTGAPV